MKNIFNYQREIVNVIPNIKLKTIKFNQLTDFEWIQYAVLDGILGQISKNHDLRFLQRSSDDEGVRIGYDAIPAEPCVLIVPELLDYEFKHSTTPVIEQVAHHIMGNDINGSVFYTLTVVKHADLQSFHKPDGSVNEKVINNNAEVVRDFGGGCFKMTALIDFAFLNDFRQKFEAVAGNYEANRVEAKKEKTLLNDLLGDFVSDGIFWRSLESSGEQQNWNEVDRKWFGMFRTDKAGRLYYKDSNNQLWMLEYQSPEKWIEDTMFWTQFKKDNGKFIINIIKQIENYIKIDGVNTQVNHISEIRKFTPRVIGDLLTVKVQIDEQEDNKFVVSNAQVYLRNGNNVDAKGQVPSLDNCIEHLARKMKRTLDMSEIQVIDDFTLTGSQYPGNIEALNSLELPFNIHLYEKEIFDPYKKLPEFTKEFLETKFAHNKLSQLYRLGKMIKCIMNPNCQYNKRMTVIAGKGSDGKSLFIDALTQWLDAKSKETLCLSLNEKVFTADASQGLFNIFNKRLIVINDVKDPTKMMDTEQFKSLTGGDTLLCNRKYMLPLEISTKGMTLCCLTNSRVFPNERFKRERISPLYFERGNVTWDKADAVNMLIKEFDEALKVIVKFVNTVEVAKVGQIRDNDILLFDDEWLLDDNVDPKAVFDTIFQIRIINEAAPDRFFNACERGSEDDEWKIMSDEMCEAIFETAFELDDDSYIKMSDLSKAILQLNENPSFRYMPLDINKKFVKTFKDWLTENKDIVYKNAIVNGKQIKAYHGLKLKGDGEVVELDF